jgi:hypothetical protein
MYGLYSNEHKIELNPDNFNGGAISCNVTIYKTSLRENEFAEITAITGNSN